MPHDDPTTQTARRRRVLAGVLAGAALAVPGVAYAAGDASTGSTAAPATAPPAVTVQDETPRDRDGDGRLCPEEEQGSGSGSSEGTAL